MNVAAIRAPSVEASRPATRWIDRLGKSAVLSALGRMRRGQIVIVDGPQRHVFGTANAACPLMAEVTVHDASFYSDVAYSGSIGAGEAYMCGVWTCDDTTSLVRLMILNREIIDGLDTLAGRWRGPFQRLAHRWSRNTRGGSRANIAAHYDLGNEFFSLFLDETMTYSCGVFETPASTLTQASAAKYDLICRKLRLSADDHLLEIGTGWGGLALHAAAKYGCRVTTTTISRAQYELARQRVERAGLSGRVELLLEDYRDLRGQYDKLVSIEMIEAVGEKFLDTYFAACGRLLKPAGLMLLQAITMPEQQYDLYRRSVDFIQRYIFPGGFLPSLGAICAATGRTTEWRLVQLEDLSGHYARTLRAWRERFNANHAAIRELGYPDSFLRMWEFYFCYCEGSFLERATGTAQIVFAGSDYRGEATAV